MSFEIKPDRYFIGMWHYPIPDHLSKFGKGGNVCGMLWRDKEMPEGTWKLQFRFRYYKDDRVFDHADAMTWYMADAHGTEEVVQLDAQKAFQLQAVLAGVKLDFYALHCNGEHVLQKFETDPPYWLHMQQSLAA